MSRVYPWDRPFGSGNERSPAVDAHLILWVVFGLPAQSAVLCCRLRSSTLELCPISIRRGSSRSVLVSLASSPVHTLQSNWAIWHCEKITALGRKVERLKTSTSCVLCAESGLERCLAEPARCHTRPFVGYSITSSAVASNLSGTVRPSILAVEALMTSSNLLDCTTGKSAGLAPLSIRPAYTPI